MQSDSGKSLATQLPTPVFVANYSPDASFTLHVCSECDAARLSVLRNWAMSQGAAARITIQTHRLQNLAHPRSLEHWLRQFSIGELIHDPTLIVSRATGLVTAAKSCRAAFGKAISGSFLDPDHRTLFILTRRKNLINSALHLRVAEIVQGAWNHAVVRSERVPDTSFKVDVQLVAELPPRKLLPVESRSASLMSRIGRKMRRWLAPTAVALALAGVASPAMALPSMGLPTAFSASAPAKSSEFGILSGLSVFADGQHWYDSQKFTSIGLQLAFGIQRQDLIRRNIILARNRHCTQVVDPQGRVHEHCIPPTVGYVGS